MATDGPYKGKLWNPHTARYVIEESIKQGLMEANCPSLHAEEYQELKQYIKDGMWVVETINGYTLRYISDFRLEFVNCVKDVLNSLACPPT